MTSTSERCASSSADDPEWLKNITFSKLLLDSPIRDEDVKEVFTTLMRDSGSWYAIGVALGVPVSKLNEIQGDNNMAATKLAQMVDYWIRNCKSHSWRSLIGVLFKMGYNSTGEAMILCAEKALFDDPTPSKGPLPNFDWALESMNRSLRESSFKPAMSRIDVREQDLFEKLAQLLGMASSGRSNDSLLDDINRHILNKPDLTRHELREILLTINLISEESKRRSIILQEHTQALEEDVKSSGKIQAELIKAKQDLQEQLFNLNKEVEDIEASYNSDFSSIQNLLKSLKEKESVIRGVKGQIEQCIQDLHYANCSYQALSNSLSECSVLLKRTLRQNERLKKIISSSKGITEICYSPRVFVGLFSYSVLFFVQFYLDAANSQEKTHFILVLTLLIIFYILFKLSDYFMLYILHQPTIDHGRVSKTWKNLIRSSGIVISFLLGIFIVVNPASVFIRVTSSVILGMLAAVAFSEVYRPPHILFHRAALYSSVVAGALIVSSLTNRDSDGNFHEPQPLSISAALLVGTVFGLIFTLFTLDLEQIKAGYLEDPIYHELLIIFFGAIVGYYSGSAVTQARAAFRIASIFGNVTGIFIGLFFYKKKILFESPPEDNVLKASMRILDESDKILESTVEKIKELQTVLVVMDHPYGSKEPYGALVVPLRHRLFRSISHDNPSNSLMPHVE